MTQKEIKSLLEKRYDREQWKRLVTTIFPARDIFAIAVEHAPESQEDRKQVKRIVQFGEAKLKDGELIGLYEAELKENIDIERNRSAVRKAVEKLVKWGGLSGALISFVAPGKGVWRFSFYSNTLSADGTWDSAHRKRYTYLLGEGEKCRTAAEQFDALVRKTGAVSLADLREAFSVEKVSKAFFREYKEHYQDFVEHLTGKRMVKEKGKWVEKRTGVPSGNKLATYFNGSEKDARDFCKKLMGRLVFLYFLQKKGWLGARTTAYTDGEPDFLYRLFQAKGDEAFYPVVLSDLFFRTLNAERANDDYRMPDGTVRKVPFLNGGLFDMDALDNKTQMLTFPPELFSTPESADEEKERGFLDFLNAYNFTVHEAGPEEQTLAVDPEMLGHIFENLLEDNKDKGAFYTPKEIVHYMCQESLTQYLKNYLVREVKGAKEDTALEGHLRAFLKDGTGAPLSAYSGLLLKALRDVKVCDPAIGSGAFPMGILHEVFQAVYNLQEFSPDEFSSIWGLEEWEPAEVKLRIIQHSIYGVDIERGAVDIARLRFWLSIIVDEPRPRTLPNLDYKIVVGDSLLGKFNGEVLEIDWNLKGNTDRVNEVRAAIEALHAKTELYFRDKTPAKKAKLEQEIRALKIELLSKQLELNRDKFKAHMQSSGRIGDLTKKEMVKATEEKLELAAYEETLGKLRTLAKQKERPLDYFDWQLDFPEMLNENVTRDPGFDIVIGNPPYVRPHNLTSELKEELWKRYSTFEKKADLFTCFIERGVSLLNARGHLAFIVSNSILRLDSFEKSRLSLLDRTSIKRIIDFEDDVFESAAVKTCIMLVSHQQTDTTVASTALLKSIEELERVNLVHIPHSKFRSNYKRLFDLSTDAWLDGIKEIMRQESVTLGSVFGVQFGLKTADDDKFLSMEPKTPEHKKLLRGGDVKRYGYKYRGEYVWYEPEMMRANRQTARPGNSARFEQPKVLIKDTGGDLAGTYESGEYYVKDVLVIEDKQKNTVALLRLTAVLNSKLMGLYYNTTFPTLHVQRNELASLPIPRTLRNIKSSPLEKLVQQRLDLYQEFEVHELEQEIDVLVCKLYGLSWEQAKVVDPGLALSKEEYEAIELPPNDEPGSSVVSEPGGPVTGLTDEGTLFGQPVEEARVKAKSKPKR